MWQLTIRERRYIIEQHEKGIILEDIGKELWYTKQEMTCVYLYRDIPDSDFLRIEEGDMFEMTVAHVVNNSHYDPDEVRRLLREFTASELITWKALKIDKSKKYGHVNMDSSIL